jgi:hypothetical protein
MKSTEITAAFIGKNVSIFSGDNILINVSKDKD